MNNVVSGASRIMNQLQVVLSIMVRYGIFVFAAVLRREAAERVAKPGPFQETAPVGLRRKGCTALAPPFSGKRSEFRSTQQAPAARNVWSTTKQSRIWAACGLRGRKNRAISQKESPRPTGNGPARCGPGILIMRAEVMYGSKLTGRQCVEGPPSICGVTGRERRRTPQLIFRQFGAPGIS